MFCAAITNQNRLMWGVQRPCLHGASCVKYGCPYKHPSDRPKDCPDGARCQKRDVCKLHHPRSCSEIACPFGLHCDKPNCTYAHDVSKTPTRFQKPCMHGAFCVKFGCGYAHPPGRRQECEFGVRCTNAACIKLHPRASKKKVGVSNPAKPKFQIGQQVQAQFRAGGTWRLANVLEVKGYIATLQFIGWTDAVDIPFERIKDTLEEINPILLPTNQKSAESAHIPPGFGSLISRGAAVARPPNSPPRIPASPRIPHLSPKPVTRRTIARKSQKFESDNMMQLERLKQAAIAKENYLLANELKQRMEKVNNLERKKAVAVREEDFLLAMGIKKEITNLLTMAPPMAPPSHCASACQNPRIGAETKQEYDNRCEREFSLFDHPVERQPSLKACC